MAGLYSYKGKSPKIHKDVFLAPEAVVVGDVEIGEGSSVWFNAVVRGDVSPVRIGKNTNIQDNATIHVMNNNVTEIGDSVLIGHNVVVHSTKIGNNVLIGSGANLGGYSEIGAFSVIAPETKVPQHKVIPAYSLVEGNPCHIVRRLREDEIEALEKSAEAYKALADDYADINQNK